jgi:hypothetical protein
MNKFCVIDRTVQAFLDRVRCEYKSAKGRVSTDGQRFYSYRMPVAEYRADGVIEVLDDGRAPTVTTASHLAQLRRALRGQKTEIVYDLGAPVCTACNTRHGSSSYPGFYREESDYWRGGGSRRNSDRKTYESGEAVCAVRLAVMKANAEAKKLTVKVKRRGFVAAPSMKYLAAVRDAGLPYLAGPAFVWEWARTATEVARNALWVAPEVARFLEMKVPHAIKRKLLARVVADPTFREAMEALVAAPDAAQAFAENYAAAHVEGKVA